MWQACYKEKNMDINPYFSCGFYSQFAKFFLVCGLQTLMYIIFNLKYENKKHVMLLIS